MMMRGGAYVFKKYSIFQCEKCVCVYIGIHDSVLIITYSSNEFNTVFQIFKSNWSLCPYLTLRTPKGAAVKRRGVLIPVNIFFQVSIFLPKLIPRV